MAKIKDCKQLELMAVYAAEVAQVWASPKMQDHCIKNAEYIVSLNNGDILEIEKPSIKKDFCFGFGMYCRSTEEEETAAANMAEHAKTNINYFVDQNLRDINDKLTYFKECAEGGKECYLFHKYSGQPDGSHLMGWRVCDKWHNPNNEPWQYSNLKALRKAEAEEIAAIIEGLEAVKADFIKRLNSYLKKYGLKNVNSWTYLVD